mgnify:CR=1 FL=1
MKRIRFLIILFLNTCILSGAISQHTENSHNTYFFKQNKGQWNSNILFKTNLAEGAMFLERQGITYHFQDKSWIRESHGKKNIPKPETIHGHVVRVSFNGSNPNSTIIQDRKAPHYENYFIGNDRSKWASNVGIYNQVIYKNMYNNIDFKIYESQTNMKYDFVVRPGGKTKNIEIEYTGADEMYIENGILYVKTSLTDIIENKPFSYQIINGETVTVPCKFRLRKNKVSFVFPDGYDKNYELIIDPFLVFSSYSGSTADNFGFTATYDTLGFTYGAGNVFGTGYRTTTGAYDTTFAGLTTTPVDIGISKFNLNGTALMYSTYLGGSADDAPHSMVTNDAGELYVFGSTGSNNFPTTVGCYDSTFAGGATLAFSLAGTGMQYAGGSDAFVAKLNTTGTALLSSTYIGGSGNDAINIGGGLNRNYGDEFRGEIIVDRSNNCYVATTTNSTNFPVVNGLGSRGGTSDGIVFKLNPTLTTLIWSTHIGGSGNDAAYGLQQDATGNTFVTGGTTSTNLTSAQNTNAGGIDGFLAKYSPANALLTTRYIGTSSYDQIYFVQIDIADSVYVFGQSLGAMPVTAGKYNNAGSHQFIQKYNNGINILNFSTVFGTGGTNIDISPSAFLVNDCGLIYMSGWGGTVNGSGSTTTGLPTTTGAYQTTTTGSDFYLMVLDKNATGLNYATFFGGSISAEHVDGGTSRFDKKGNVYQAVCAGCGGRNDFPTSTSAWSTTNGSTNCNLGVFKFNINEIKASASVPTVTICYPAAAIFGNNSRNGNTFHWDFGDGNTSSVFAPTHNYASAGIYNVVLTVSDSTGCILPDTANITITVFDPASAVVTPDTNICQGNSIQLNATGGTTYIWSPAATLSNATIANPIATPTVPTTYMVIVTNPCGSDTSYVNIGFHTITTTTSNDTTICVGDTAQIYATGGGTYSWSPFTNIINPSTATPRVFPTATTQYIVSVVTPEGCPASDTVNITVIDIPRPVLSPDDSICYGDLITLNASGATSYLWYPSKDLNISSGPTVTANPVTTTTFYVDFSNQCATLVDSVTITVVTPQAFSSPDDTVCFNQSIQLWASGGVSYSWRPSAYVSNPTSDTTFANPPTPTEFWVVVTDAVGCTDTAYTNISFSPIPFVNAGPDQIINFGEIANLFATSSAGSFYWSPNTSLSSTTSKATIAQPSNTTLYIANLLDDYGCLVSDTVIISLDGSIFVPNSFSPNGDGINDVFRVYTEDLTQFEIMIFNRWGELLFESRSKDAEWDGKYKGKLSQVDTYVWKIVYSDVNTSKKEVIGHVNIIR